MPRRTTPEEEELAPVVEDEGEEEEEETEDQAVNIEHRIIRLGTTADQQFSNYEKDIPAEAHQVVNELYAQANPICVRCGNVSGTVYWGCSQGHGACQSCWNNPDKLEEVRRGKTQCAVHNCIGHIPDFNRAGGRAPKFAVKEDAIKTAEVKAAKLRLQKMKAALVAQVFAAKKNLAIATEKAMREGRKQGGGTRKAALTKASVFKQVMQRFVGVTETMMEEERRQPGSQPAAVAEAVAAAKAEWARVNPNKMRAERKRAREDEEKKQEEVAAQVATLLEKNEELQRQLQAMVAQLSKAEADMAGVRLELAVAETKLAAAQGELAGIRAGAGSSAGPVPGAEELALDSVQALQRDVLQLSRQVALQLQKRDAAENARDDLARQLEDAAMLVAKAREEKAALQQLHDACLLQHRRARQATEQRMRELAAAAEPDDHPRSPMGHASLEVVQDEDKAAELAAEGMPSANLGFEPMDDE